jgi:hypothetical protein
MHEFFKVLSLCCTLAQLYAGKVTVILLNEYTSKNSHVEKFVQWVISVTVQNIGHGVDVQLI